MIEDFEVSVERVAADVARLRVRVPEDLRFFEGHFEGNPMLPGVAQLVALVHRRAGEVFGPLGREARIARLKFESVIAPGDRLEVGLERAAGSAPGETQVKFRIARGTQTCTSGAVVYVSDAPTT